MVVGVATVLGSLLADLSYAVLDPRVEAPMSLASPRDSRGTGWE